MTTLHRTAVLLLALAASAASFAQSDEHPKAAPEAHDHQMRAQRMAERFKSADTNHDGKLTLEEAQAGMPMVAKHFEEIDTAKTGSVTLEQVMAAAKTMRRGHRAGNAE